MRYVGVNASGIRLPILRENDDLIEEILHALEAAEINNEICLRNKDIIGVTESLLARTQGNVVLLEDITKEFNRRFKKEKIGVIFPIMSRNRFSHILKALADTGKEIFVLLDAPRDEVGNQLISDRELHNSNFNPYQDLINSKEFYDLFGKPSHVYTNVDYIELYESIGDNISVFVGKNIEKFVSMVDHVIIGNTHGRDEMKERLMDLGVESYHLGEFRNKKIEGQGYNEDFGLMGCNLSKDGFVKLFPRNNQEFVEDLQKKIKEELRVDVEVLIYGDGAFKDPVGMIWELADPMVCPGYTKGLEGTPDELKLKYIADNEMNDMTQNDFKEHMKSRAAKTDDSQGTTPRKIVDLVGTMCDLVSGSGDKGTPIVLVQGYFDKYTDEY